MRRHLLAALVACCSASAVRAEDAGKVVLDMDTVRHRPTETATRDKQKVDAGTVELVEGKVGKACRFSFVESAAPAFMTAWVNATAEWDRAAGISFWVKGDGSVSWGGLELIDGKDYALRYGVCFPIDSMEWRKIVVPWRDVLPELRGPLVGAKGGYAPSRFRNVWFGKWFYWREFPAHSFAIDQIALEPRVDLPAVKAAGRGLDRLRAKLEARKPVTIVTMGDSLTDTRHWANRQAVWCALVAEALRKRHGGDVTLVNPAIGGTTLTQNLILMPRWLKQAPKPDLVTVWFGYNDWDSGVRGPRFREYLVASVERIRRMTEGSADILLMTTCPAHSRWDTMREMAEAVREVAKAEGTGLADVEAAFHQTGSADEARQRGLWARDNTHLGQQGHRLVSECVLRAIHAGR